MRISVRKEDILSGMWAGSLTLAVLLISFAVGGLFPFGEGTIAWCDMNQQLIPLFCDFKDILSGEKSLFLNTANGGGMNFYGVYFFFLSSPFSFLAAFVSKANITFLMNVLVILKLALAGFTAGFVLKKSAHHLNYGVIAALGASYALCGYGMMYYQNLMWLDIMYMFPLVVWGILLLMKDNEPLVLTVSLTLTVILNFYLSFMVYLFVIFYFGIFAAVFKKADRRIYASLGLCGFISLLCSAWVWLPCFLQYISSARSGSGIANLVQVGFFAPVETTLPIILSGSIVIAALLITVPNFGSLGKRSKQWFFVFLLTCIPLVVEPINKLWHMGSYMSFPARYGFITVFAGIMLAASVMSKEVNLARSHRLIGLLGFLVVIFAVFGILLAVKNNGVLSAYVNTLWGDENSLQMAILISGVFAACYYALLLFSKKKLLGQRLLALLLCLTVAAEGFCAIKTYMISAKGSFDTDTYLQVLSLKEQADKDSFYRVNTTHKITDANMTGAAGFNSLAHYTSLNSKVYMNSAKKMGYSGYWMETGNWCGSIISDALLSVGYTVNKTSEGLVLKENPYYMELGIYSAGDIPEATSNVDRLMEIGKAFGDITGTENSVTKYFPQSLRDCEITYQDDLTVIENYLENGIIEYNIKVSKPQTLYFDCYNGFSTSLVEIVNNSFEVYVNGELFYSSYPTQSYNGLLNLGSFEEETVNIMLKSLKSVSCSSFGVFGVDENAVKAAVDGTETANLTESGGVISGEVKAGKLFLSIPKGKFLKATLNGKPIACKQALNGFTVLNITEAGTLEIGFTPMGFRPSIMLSLAGIGFFILLILHRRKKKNSFDKAYNVIYGIFLGLVFVALCIIYFIPLLLSFSDLMPI